MSVTQSQSDWRYKSHVPSCRSAGYLRKFARHINRMLTARLLISELLRLDDHLLIDVGIEDRADVPQFARRVALNKTAAKPQH